MRVKFLSYICALILAVPLFAQSPDKVKLDQYFDALDANNKWMGTVSVAKDGKTIYSRSIGYLDVEKKTKLNENSKFRIGSISKSFTAAMVFKAIEENKLALDTKLDKFFATVPNASKITIAHLLNHSSGIHNFTSDPTFLSWHTAPQTEAKMLEAIAKGGSDFEPGIKADYSNSNYVLLSYILEKAYNKPYKELVEKIIVKPLNLKNTYYGGKISTGANEAISYKFKGSWLKENETDMSVPMGAGAMVSTSADLVRFFEGLFAGKVVGMASLSQMKTIKDDYGMGLFEFDIAGKTGYGHNGAIDGFTSMAGYFPEDKIAFAFISNADNFDESITTAITNWLFSKPFDIPDFSIYSYKTEDLDKYLGVYSSPQIPLKITVTKKDTTLIAQASGQLPFPLAAAKQHSFRFDTTGIVLDFNPGQRQMVLKQGGASYSFTKE